jgi:hypothetical protein
VLKKLVFLAIVVAAVWYGSKHYQTLMPTKSGDIEVVNHSGRGVDRLRISVNNQTIVIESLEDGATTKVPFQPKSDGMFTLIWVARGLQGEPTWSGGNASAGPELKTHKFEFRENAGVIWSSEIKAK